MGIFDINSAMNHDVFISHSIKDQEAADCVYTYLESNGFKCFMDTPDLTPGDTYHTQLATAIRESRIVILVFSSNSDSSKAVQNEVAIAINNRIPVIPLRIEDTLPHELEFFIATSQWLDAFLPPLEKHLPKLENAIKRHLGQKDEDELPEQTELYIEDCAEAPTTRFLNDHKWHDVEYDDLKDWVKRSKDRLHQGEELVGKVFRYRYNRNTGKYQIRLRHRYNSATYER